MRIYGIRQSKRVRLFYVGENADSCPRQMSQMRGKDGQNEECNVCRLNQMPGRTARTRVLTHLLQSDRLNLPLSFCRFISYSYLDLRSSYGLRSEIKRKTSVFLLYFAHLFVPWPAVELRSSLGNKKKNFRFPFVFRSLIRTFDLRS